MKTADFWEELSSHQKKELTVLVGITTAYLKFKLTTVPWLLTVKQAFDLCDYSQNTSVHLSITDFEEQENEISI